MQVNKAYVSLFKLLNFKTFFDIEFNDLRRHNGTIQSVTLFLPE